MFWDSNSWVFLIIDCNQQSFFWFENEGDQLFLIWVIFWKLIWKLANVLQGEIVVSMENNFWLPKSARSVQTVDNSHVLILIQGPWSFQLLSCSSSFCGKSSESKQIIRSDPVYWEVYKNFTGHGWAFVFYNDDTSSEKLLQLLRVAILGGVFIAE